MPHRGIGGTEQKPGNAVGQDAVLFLRHRHVEGAQPRLHMNDRDQQLGCGDRARQGGVGVPVYHQVIRLLLQQDVLDPHHHGRGLLRMAPRSDAEVIVRPGNLQLFEKDIRHIAVVMLAGMHQQLLIFPPQRPGHRRRLRYPGPPVCRGEGRGLRIGGAVRTGPGPAA